MSRPHLKFRKANSETVALGGYDAAIRLAFVRLEQTVEPEGLLADSYELINYQRSLSN